jgi:hypothetical protein
MEHFDLDAAVRAGVLRSDQADALRRLDEKQRHAPSATEERFAFISGFADFMAAVGLILMAGTSMMMLAKSPLLAVAYPFLCWWAATFFTAKRRLMFTSFVIFVVFALSSAMGALGTTLVALGTNPLSAQYRDIPSFGAVLISGIVSAACWFYWRRFGLPVSFAAFAVALANFIICCIRVALPGMPGWGVGFLVGLTGPALFATAMWWDMSDVRRETIRSDVAFWLHIAAGFLLVKAAMALILGTRHSDAGWGRMFFQVADPSGAGALGVVILFLAFATIALVIDRRSLLTSGMFYLIPAIASLAGGLVYTNIAPAMFVAGALLTVLAVRWTGLREALLRRLPDKLVAQLPRTQLSAVGPRPVY